MKTIGDCDRWIKAGGGKRSVSLRMHHNGTFNVVLNDANESVETASKVSLESAIENAMEELRRKENGAESVRTEKHKAVQQTTMGISMATLQQALANRPAFNFSGSVGPKTPVYQAAGNPPTHVMLCPMCGVSASGLNRVGNWICGANSGHTWCDPPVLGRRYRLGNLFSTAEWTFDGFDNTGLARWK